jgi:hypothetical protein
MLGGTQGHRKTCEVAIFNIKKYHRSIGEGRQGTLKIGINFTIYYFRSRINFVKHETKRQKMAKRK